MGWLVKDEGNGRGGWKGEKEGDGEPFGLFYRLAWNKTLQYDVIPGEPLHSNCTRLWTWSGAAVTVCLSNSLSDCLHFLTEPRSITPSRCEHLQPDQTDQFLIYLQTSTQTSAARNFPASGRKIFGRCFEGNVESTEVCNSDVVTVIKRVLVCYLWSRIIPLKPFYADRYTRLRNLRYNLSEVDGSEGLFSLLYLYIVAPQSHGPSFPVYSKIDGYSRV